MSKRNRDAETRRRSDAEKKKEDSEEKAALLSPRPRVSASPPRLRIFCAVELPADVRAQAARYIAELRERAPDARAGWEREEKMHLTLKFLGELEEERVSQID